MYKQLCIHFKAILSSRNFSTQHCLLVMIEKLKEAVDNSNKFGALLTDMTFRKHSIALIFLYYLQNFMGIEYHIHR